MSKSQKENKIQFAVIEWRDSVNHSNEMDTKEVAMKKSRLAHLLTCGFIIGEDEEKIVIGIDYNIGSKKFRHIYTRAKSAIENIQRFDIEIPEFK